MLKATEKLERLKFQDGQRLIIAKEGDTVEGVSDASLQIMLDNGYLVEVKESKPVVEDKELKPVAENKAAKTKKAK
jgi:hypothetical protein